MSPLNKNILIGAFTFLAFANCIRLFWDNSPYIFFGSFDTGWIIRTGEYVLNHGIPRQDFFSWTFPNQVFVAYQWLFELMMAFLFKLGGLWLVGFYGCVSSGLLYFFVLPRLWICRGIPPALPFVALALVLTPHWFNVRPQLVSYFLLLFFVMVLENYRSFRRPVILCLLPPLMLFWVNVHLFWIIGLMLLVVYLVCDCYRKPPEKSKLSRLALPATLAACAGMVCLNPYGISIFAYLYSFLNGSQYMGMYEVRPSFVLREAVFVLAYLAIAWRILWLKRMSLPAEAWFVTIFSTFAALAVRRYESIAVLLTWPYVGVALAQFRWTDSFLIPSGRLHECFRLLEKKGLCLLATATILALSVWYLRAPSEDSARAIYCEGSAQLLDVVGKYLTKQDRLFNDATTGDWLILYKTAPVFVDTRYDMYPRIFCENVFACVYGAPGGLDFIKNYGASQILVRDEFTPICKSLKESQDWLLVCDDGTLSFWTRNKSFEKKRMEQAKVSDELIHDSGWPEALIESTIQGRCRQYFTLAKLYSTKDSAQTGRAIELLQRALVLIPNSKILNDELERLQQKKSRVGPSGISKGYSDGIN